MLFLYGAIMVIMIVLVCFTLFGRHTCFHRSSIELKGNLAHNFMDLYILCLSFHLDISNMLKTKYIGNTGLPASHRGEKIQFGNLSNLGFQITPLVMSLL